MRSPLGPLLAGVLLLAACASAPAERLSWRESWNLVVLDESGLLVDAQLTKGNTGLLKGQGHLSMTVFPQRDSTVLLRRTAPPQAVTWDADDGGLRLMQDRLEQGRDGWTLHVREGREALDATIHLTSRAPELAPATLVEGQRQWIMGVPVPHGQATGAWRAGEQGGLIRGYGVLVRQSTDTWPGEQPSRSSLYLITPERSIGIEQLGERSLTWMADGAGVHSGSSAQVQRRGRIVHIDLQPDLPVTARVRVGVRAVLREPWDHLLPFERLLARLVAGWPQRTHERGRAQLQVGDHTTVTTALLVHGQIPVSKKRRRAAAKAGE